MTSSYILSKGKNAREKYDIMVNLLKKIIKLSK